MTLGNLLLLVLFLIVIGYGLYYINVKVTMQDTIKTILNIAVIIFAILLVMQTFGIIGSLRELRLR